MTILKNLYIANRVHDLLCISFTFFYGFFHPLKKQVLFRSFHGKQYSDNPKAISEKLHEMFPDYRIVWFLRKEIDINTANIPKYVLIISTPVEFYKQLSQSKCFVTNEPILNNIYKRRGQFFVQTWHGDRGLKKILLDNTNNQNYYEIKDSQLTDLCVAGSNFGVLRYRTAFNYNGDILSVGCPRNDKLIRYNQKDVLELKLRLGISLQKKIVMYAPTFRDRDNETKLNNYIDMNKVLRWLNEKTNDEWICIIRYHTQSKSKQVYSKSSDLLDLTDYQDMSELLLITDLLITDYSSSAGDYMLLNRPLVLTIFDYHEFHSYCRELYFPIEDFSFPIAKSYDELRELIVKSLQNNCMLNRDKVFDFYGVRESGVAAESVCRWINDHCI